MKLLLTSAGIKNPSIHDALVDSWSKPIAESNALCIPTASYGHPMAGPGRAWRFISGQEPRCPMVELGGNRWACWSSPRCPASRKSCGSLGPGDRRAAGERRRRVVSLLLDAAVGTGRAPAVAVRGLGGAERRKHGDDSEHREGLRQLDSSTGGDETLGVVDFSIFPHLDHPDLRQYHGQCRKVGRGHDGPAYAIDDETAIKVDGGAVDVVSEGQSEVSLATTPITTVEKFLFELSPVRALPGEPGASAPGSTAENESGGL